MDQRSLNAQYVMFNIRFLLRRGAFARNIVRKTETPEALISEIINLQHTMFNIHFPIKLLW